VKSLGCCCFKGLNKKSRCALFSFFWRRKGKKRTHHRHHAKNLLQNKKSNAPPPSAGDHPIGLFQGKGGGKGLITGCCWGEERHWWRGPLVTRQKEKVSGCPVLGGGKKSPVWGETAPMATRDRKKRVFRKKPGSPGSTPGFAVKEEGERRKLTVRRPGVQGKVKKAINKEKKWALPVNKK